MSKALVPWGIFVDGVFSETMQRLFDRFKSCFQSIAFFLRNLLLAVQDHSYRLALLITFLISTDMVLVLCSDKAAILSIGIVSPDKGSILFYLVRNG